MNQQKLDIGDLAYVDFADQLSRKSRCYPVLYLGSDTRLFLDYDWVPILNYISVSSYLYAYTHPANQFQRKDIWARQDPNVEVIW